MSARPHQDRRVKVKRQQPSPPPIAYLLKRFPRLSETFILHEMLELERQGADLRIYSLMNPGDEIVHADVARVQAAIRYLPTAWAAVWPLLRAHLALAGRNPGHYLAVVIYILLRRRHLSTLKHFVRAGWLARELEREGVRHLHAHFAHGPASVAHFVHLLTGLPYSFTAHAKDIYTSPPDLLAVKMQAARFVVTCTAYNARYLSGLVGPATARRIHRIYHGVDLHKFSANGHSIAQENTTAAPTILAVGRLVEKKGLRYLVEAFALLVAQGYTARLDIVGSGECKDALKEQIVAAGLREQVTLLGARPQEEVIALYHAATVFALPCIVADNGDRDGIPNVLVEAMRCGVPVVSTDVSGIPELVIDGETGLVVPPRDAAALAAALGCLLDDRALREGLAARAARHVTHEFDLAINASRLRALLYEGQ